jgi:hypothetical protein
LVSKVSPSLFVISFLITPTPEKKIKIKTEAKMQEVEKGDRKQEED